MYYILSFPAHAQSATLCSSPDIHGLRCPGRQCGPASVLKIEPWKLQIHHIATFLVRKKFFLKVGYVYRSLGGEPWS
jgi:hypothetical protein